MSRQLMRVPLDFEFPLDETWPGYLRPRYRPCLAGSECHGGATASQGWLVAFAHLLAMAADDTAEVARGRLLHPYLANLENAPGEWDQDAGIFGQRHRVYRPGPGMVEFVEGMLEGVEQKGSFLGYDYHRLYKRLVEAAGLPPDWGTCPVCHGEAIHPDDIAARDAWEPTDPPTGDGFQLWQFTSEGSPISPVFATLTELCEYAAANCTVFAGSTASAEGWEQMLTDGFVAARQQMPDGTEILWI